MYCIPCILLHHSFVCSNGWPQRLHDHKQQQHNSKGKEDKEQQHNRKGKEDKDSLGGSPGVSGGPLEILKFWSRLKTEDRTNVKRGKAALVNRATSITFTFWLS